MKLAYRILSLIENTGPREPGLMQRILRAKPADYQRAIGFLALKGLIIFRGKTNGRKVHLNGRRSNGFTQVQMIAAVAALGILAGIFVLVRGYINDVDARAYKRGAAETTAKWEARELKQNAAHAAELEKLRGDRDSALRILHDALQQAQVDFEKARKGRDDERAKNARLERDLRDARVVFRDPGRTGAAASGAACSGQGAADPGAGADGDGKAAPKQGDLSPELAGFLWAESGRADEVVKDLEERLELAQDNVTAYYLLAKDCHEGRR